MQNNISGGAPSILVTGANGFIGKALCAELLRQGQYVRGAMRSVRLPIENLEAVSTGAIDGETDWTKALLGIKVVVHLAARVHLMKDNAVNPLDEMHKVNVEGAWKISEKEFKKNNFKKEAVFEDNLIEERKKLSMVKHREKRE